MPNCTGVIKGKVNAMAGKAGRGEEGTIQIEKKVSATG